MKTKAILIAVLFMGMLPIAAQAQYSYAFDYASNTSYMTTFRTISTAKVGYDAGETYAPVNEKWINSAIYKELGQDGWDWNTGFYEADHRPLLNAEETVLLRSIYLWAGTLAPVSDLQLYHVYPVVMSPGMTYTLRLVQIPVGITYIGPTEWGPNHGTITLPFFATNDGTKGYKFEVEITAPVPEPSSLLVLAGGLIGVGGLALRRKKS